MSNPKILKKKITITFVVVILLILFSGVLGWKLTQQIERSDKIIATVHTLQLRREEKNLLIRGYSQQRYLRWQNAKENFHQRFGELIGMEALSDTEKNAIKSDYSEMSSTYNNFFHELKTNSLSQDKIITYDEQFKKIGRKTIEMINEILNREKELSNKTDWQANILIAIFIIIFIATTSFLIVNVIKHL